MGSTMPNTDYNHIKTTVLRKMFYEPADTYIYLLHFRCTFQYLFAHKDEIYRQEVGVCPQWWRLLLWPFGCKLYSQDQLESIEKAIISGAVETLDKLKLKSEIS